MSDCPQREQLERLLAEQLVGPDLDVLESHVELCAACQEVLARLAGDALVSATAPPSAGRPSQQGPAAAFIRRLKQAPPDGPTLRAAAPPDQWPTVAGYQLLGELGRGGMGGSSTGPGKAACSARWPSR
jgi:hypothetical protein